MYNYLEAMAEDVKQAIKENAEYDLQDLLYDRYNFEEKLLDDFWIHDDITGNASGSYFCNSNKAKECVIDNIDLCKEALYELCVSAEEIGERFLNEDWEYLDVTIRCYLLGQAISKALDDLENLVLDEHLFSNI